MIFILTGPRHSGKTSLLKKIVVVLKKKGVQLQGFLSLPVYKNDHFLGYDLYDLSREKSVLFIRKKGEPHWEPVGRLYFVPLGLVYAKEVIKQSDPRSFLVVDEIGSKELKGQGLWPELKKIIFNEQRNFLLVVRKKLLSPYLDLLGQKETEIFDSQDKSIFLSLKKL